MLPATNRWHPTRRTAARRWQRANYRAVPEVVKALETLLHGRIYSPLSSAFGSEVRYDDLRARPVRCPAARR